MSDYTFTSKSIPSTYFEGGTVWQNPKNSSYVSQINPPWRISEVETICQVDQAGRPEVQVRIKFENQETIFLKSSAEKPVSIENNQR